MPGAFLGAFCSPVTRAPGKDGSFYFVGLVCTKAPPPSLWADSWCVLSWMEEALNLSFLVRPRVCAFQWLHGSWGAGNPSASCTSAGTSLWSRLRLVASVCLTLPSWAQRPLLPPGARAGSQEQGAPPQPALLPPGGQQGQCQHCLGSPRRVLISPWASRGAGRANCVQEDIPASLGREPEIRLQ